MGYTRFDKVVGINGLYTGAKGSEVKIADTVSYFTDDTTAGISEQTLGTLSTPQTLTVAPGATVVVDTVNVQHTLGAGNCDDLIARYEKAAVLGAGDAGITVVGNAARCYVGTDGSNAVASQAYGTQTWAKHDGIGAITAMSALSALVDVNTGNFTASTINAGHFHVEGAGTVTGQFDGVMIEVYPDVTNLDSGLAIAVDAGAVVDSAIRITGTPVNQCDIKLHGTVNVYSGVAVTRAAARAAAGSGVPIGSMFVGQGAVATTKPNFYIKTANAGADTDWERLVTQASD